MTQEVSETMPIIEPQVKVVGGHFRILLVEDNAVNQKLAVRLLEKMGHQVALASNGAEACEALCAATYDIVLMDLQMPVMGGLEATCKIREREQHSGRHVPILAMTAHSAAQDEKRCLEAGMDGYLTKPIRREVLRKEIDRAVTQNGSSGNWKSRRRIANFPKPNGMSASCWSGSRATRTCSANSCRCSEPTVKRH